MGTDHLECSDSVLALHGIDRSTFSGSAAELFARLHVEDEPRLKRVIERAVTRGETYETAYRVRDDDGEVRNLQVRGVAFERGGEQIVSGTCVDLGETAHRALLEGWVARAAELLGRAETIHEALDGIATITVERLADCCVVYLARGWASEEPGRLEPVGMASADNAPTDRLHRVLEPPVMGVDATVLAGSREWPSAETRWPDPEIRADLGGLGIEWWVDAPLRFEGRVIGVLTLLGGIRTPDWTVEDLDAAKRVAFQIGQALARIAFRQAARDAIASRDEVLAIVSHDLRNPLNTIHMASTVLRMGADEGVGRRLDAIDRAVKRADSMIRDLLEVAKVSGGSLSLSPASVPLSSLADDVEALFAPQAEAKSVHFSVDACDGIAVLDRQRIVQVLANLIGNAIRHTPADGEVRVAMESADSAWRFRVCDTGPGIPPDQAPLLFEPFWQSRKARNKGGAGLGLAIARGIVEAHRGRIWVESEPGEGAQFVFMIPANVSKNPGSVSVISP